MFFASGFVQNLFSLVMFCASHPQAIEQSCFVIRFKNFSFPKKYITGLFKQKVGNFDWMKFKPDGIGMMRRFIEPDCTARTVKDFYVT